MIYERKIQTQIEKYLFKKRAIVLYGARQTGKTTLVKNIMGKFSKKKTLYLDGEDPANIENLSSATVESLKNLYGEIDLLIIDEAQKVKNIGQTLKLFVDHFPQTQIIATGSSSFELSNEIIEPLTGRKFEFYLYPIALSEIITTSSRAEVDLKIDEYLKYGMYPAVLNNSGELKEKILKELTGSYLFKDILVFENIRNPDLLRKLLQLIALQIGSEVSLHELATSLGVDKNTVDRYLDLLEKAYIIFRLPALSKNQRKEIVKKKKIFFYDLGIRNTLVQNYAPLHLRTDSGGIWENFCVAERMKFLLNQDNARNMYFWRNYDGQEIDLVEEKQANIFDAFEFKIKEKKVKLPQSFQENYELENFSVIHRKNWWELLENCK
jgi:uncharacterized protein